MTEKRKLVGRRFEDFTRHQIMLELTLSENIRDSVITDVRYQPRLDRRLHVRRQSDANNNNGDSVFQSGSSGIYLSAMFDNWSD